jgi:hypothetical protein
MSVPVSPTYTDFHPESPYSEASSASFPPDGSQSPFDDMPVVADEYYYQSDLVYPASGEHDSDSYPYTLPMHWTPITKKDQLNHYPQQHQQQQQPLSIYIPTSHHQHAQATQSPSVIHSPVPQHHAQAQPQPHQLQQPLLDLNLGEWHAASAGMSIR